MCTMKDSFTEPGPADDFIPPIAVGDTENAELVLKALRLYLIVSARAARDVYRCPESTLSGMMDAMESMSNLIDRTERLTAAMEVANKIVRPPLPNVI